jgi:hypothetical protein
MDPRTILIQALLYLIEKYGPQILDAVGELLLALIKSLTPEQKKELAKSAGVSDDIIAETFTNA